MNDVGDRDNNQDNEFEENNMPGKERFIYPQSRYRGEFTPENLAFNSNLQEFAQRISIICNLETNGKIAPDVAYKQINSLCKELKQSTKEFLDN